jgi:predicted nucleic acid-binding protein
MNGVLDASMALAWLFKRVDATEAALADQALCDLPSASWVVPAIWYAEVANGLLRGERAGLTQPAQTEFFLNRVSLAQIEMDQESPRTHQVRLLALARAHRLTAYDSAYLELALRMGRTLATFDQKLADAMRKAGGQVFGDAAIGSALRAPQLRIRERGPA